MQLDKSDIRVDGLESGLYRSCPWWIVVGVVDVVLVGDAEEEGGEIG